MRIRASRLTGATATVALLVAACGDSASSPMAPPAVSLPGTRWVVDGMTVDGEPYVLVTDPTIEFSADGAGVSGLSGCNTFFASVDYGSPGELAIDELASTLMGCEDDLVAEQGLVFNQALQLLTAYQVDGDRLTLAGSGGAVEIAALSREVAIPTAALGGTRWHAISFTTGLFVRQPAGLTITLDVVAGTFQGNDECNDFGGTVTVDGDSITFDDIAGTAIACDDAVMKRSDEEVDILRAVSHHSIDGRELTLQTDDDRSLDFRAD
jgi:heat shock protein HslJ